MQPSQQLPLGLKLKTQATFTNFLPSENQLAANYLRDFTQGSGEPFLCLWGAAGTGRSHLLQAACHAVSEQGNVAVYLPLAAGLRPEALSNLELTTLVCLDDLDAIVGDPIWEEMLFHWLNRVQATPLRVIVATRDVPHQLPWGLADLRSRLAAFLSFHLAPLNDENKLFVLQQRAKAQGLLLAETVGNYLLRHYNRNMTALMLALEQLDQASFVEQRRLSIPFVKKILNHERA